MAYQKIINIVNQIKNNNIRNIHFNHSDLIKNLISINKIIIPGDFKYFSILTELSDSTIKSINKCHPVALTIALNDLHKGHNKINSRSLRESISKSGSKIIQKLNHELRFDIVEYYANLSNPRQFKELIALQFCTYDSPHKIIEFSKDEYLHESISA